MKQNNFYFSTETATFISIIIISTLLCMQVPVFNHDVFLSFGAVVPNGYGVCYNPQENKFLFGVSSFRSCPETDSVTFGSKLVQSMQEMRNMLLAGKRLPSKL